LKEGQRLRFVGGPGGVATGTVSFRHRRHRSSGTASAVEGRGRRLPVMASKNKPDTHLPTIRDLSPRNAQHISAGKARKTPNDYMIYKFYDLLISNVTL
jgi:hypothetical protein